MLVNELKNKIKEYDKKDLEKIIVELYKRIPKAKKEDYNIDTFIENIKIDKSIKKKELDFNYLKKEIIYFLQCVDHEYYVIPNRVVSKKDRSTWRFKAKRFYKELNKIFPSHEDGNDATTLLIELFRRLSIGSNTLLFTNWETFRALGVSQGDYYDVIIKRILYNGYTKENLEKCIDLLDIPKDPYELSYDMYWIFISNLKTTDNKETTIEIMNNKVNDLKSKLKEAKNYNIEFSITENINNYVECITEIYLSLHEINDGISYFQKNYIERSKEVKEYILLSKLEDLNLKEAWINEYEKNMNKIKFRDSLNEKYIKLKKSRTE